MNTMNEAVEAVEVTQADRDASAHLARILRMICHQCGIDGIKQSRKRRSYVRAMLSALDGCREGIFMKPTSRSRALYCIREFEQINAMRFNPFNDYHCSLVSGMGPYSAVFWRVKRLDRLRGSRSLFSADRVA